jgi:hypothetical protein
MLLEVVGKLNSSPTAMHYLTEVQVRLRAVAPFGSTARAM